MKVIHFQHFKGWVVIICHIMLSFGFVANFDDVL